MNGLSGLGVSETASTDLFNRYLSQQGSIDTAHNTASSDLLKNYLTDRKAEQDALFETAEGIIKNHDFDSTDTLDRYLESLKGKLSDEHLAALDMYAAVEKKAFTDAQTAQQEAEAEAEKAKGFDTNYKLVNDIVPNEGKNLQITNSEGTDVLDLQIKREVTEAIPTAAALNYENGTVFSVENKFFLRYGDKVYELEDRYWQQEEEGSPYDKLYGQFIGPPLKKKKTFLKSGIEAFMPDVSLAEYLFGTDDPYKIFGIDKQ